ncbi:alpha/beta fold hydrolase [Kitasatospora sp. NPDC051853]|uniref:alpha/beta fold hydrolase n=1 Tax=Kitasatospora sp. NPDC051853 TaxID=3364058 RepID=UPI00378861A6
MKSIYRSPEGRQAVRRWCAERLDAWPVPHEHLRLTAAGADTRVLTAGSGKVVVFVPGTNLNAAASLPFLSALVAAGCRVLVPDVPGQPGLSDGRRGLSGGRLDWYGGWLDEVLEQVAAGLPARSVVLTGHSFGAAVALSARSPLVRRSVLLSPGGLCGLRLTPGLLAASAAWYLRPGPARSERLVRAMHGPGHLPAPELVEWMTLVARHSRSSGAPGLAVPPPAGDRPPLLVVSGGHDVFLPPRRLAPAVRRALGTELRVVEAAGHLLVDEHPELLAGLVTAGDAPARIAAPGSALHSDSSDGRGGPPL